MNAAHWAGGGTCDLLYPAIVDVKPHHLVCARGVAGPDKRPHQGQGVYMAECHEAGWMDELAWRPKPGKAVVANCRTATTRSLSGAVLELSTAAAGSSCSSASWKVSTSRLRCSSGMAAAVA